MKEHVPNVLILVPTLESGGAERHAITLLNELNGTLIHAHLAYLKRMETLLPALRTERRSVTWCCDAGDGLDRHAVRRLVQWIDAHEIDIIVCVNSYSTAYGFLARLFSRSRPALVTIYHSTILQTTRDRLLARCLYRYLFRTCDLMLYVSNIQRNYWRAHGVAARADAVIHNGIDVDLFQARYTEAQRADLRRELGFAPEDYLIGLCAGLRPEKAHGDLLRAIAQLREQGLPAKALLIGDGPERAAIEREVIRLALRGHVAITGFKADVRPYVGCCDAMVLVSRSEGFSLAALEAMALGKPMVMAEVGGASEQIVHGEHGFLYPVGDTAALARHLAALAEPRLRRTMGDAAAARVRERFTMQAMVAEYERRLLGLCRGGQLRHTRSRSRMRMRSTPTQ